MSDFNRRLLAGIALAALSFAGAAQAQTEDPTMRDSFAIGDKGGSLCEVQATVRDGVISGMFDRAWVIICRDASQPVGYVRMLRAGPDAALARIKSNRAGTIDCDANDACTVKNSNIAWKTRIETAGDTSYVAEGFAAYDDALGLALNSIKDRQIISGVINVASVSVGANDGFARTLAGNIDVDKALAEGYRRNQSGNYAEAAEFFEALSRRTADEEGEAGLDPTEFTLNRALQKSNLGEFSEADRLFGDVEASPTVDMVQLRLRRNFRAIHALNQRDYETAAEILLMPLPAIPSALEITDGAVTLTPAMVAGINSSDKARTVQQTSDHLHLTPIERAKIIDAQAVHLLGTTERLRGNAEAAERDQKKALSDAVAVREGRVTSIVRLRSQILGELALAEEALGEMDMARSKFQESVNVLAVEYPETNALASARARYASFLARHGQDDDALALYKQIIGDLSATQRSTTGMANLMAPYYRLLADRANSDPAAVNDFFFASQLQVRPGVADTQAVLARELSGGSDDSARLFRQVTTLNRDIERARVEDARLAQLDVTPDIAASRADLARRLTNLTFQQSESLIQLNAFPQYRVVSQDKIDLAALQATLEDDEAYVKMLVVGEGVYVMLIEPKDAHLWRADISNDKLTQEVDALRSTISIVENGRRLTYPFDAATSRKLYKQLFGPVSDRLPLIAKLIFEPDGAMLRLPVNLLITSDTGLAAYESRVMDPNADPFDMRDIVWLGKTTRASTAVSPSAFHNARKAAPSTAADQYFGFGQNQPAQVSQPAVANRAAMADGSDLQCQWDLSVWNRPISDKELLKARSILGRDDSIVLTGAGFSDDAVLARTDLANYRILHFATHGLVTAPRVGCPARPALVTSFGKNNSDGLLTFQEIFDLKLDADLVILSACDTAGAASVSATRAAGISSGGGNALDGLVRAFIGAGSRSVVASHWPVPDDFDATNRLIDGLFTSPAGTPMVDALWGAQKRLMADPQTSHPYYWAGFAIIGDGNQPVIRQSTPAPTTTARVGKPLHDAAR